MKGIRFSMAFLFSVLVVTKVTGWDVVRTVGWSPVIGLWVEVAIACAFWAGWIRTAAALGTVFFAVALSLAVILPQGECGCLGGWVVLASRASKVTAAALGGLLCSGTWYLCGSRSVECVNQG